MQHFVLLFFLVEFSFGVTGPFNLPGGYLCANRLPSDRITRVNSTLQLRRPQFFPCLQGNGQPQQGMQRDHLLELQLLKAFINYDDENSLSCETIDFLNRAPGYPGVWGAPLNVRCIPPWANQVKAALFSELLGGGGSNCTLRRPFIASAVRCVLTGSNLEAPMSGSGSTSSRCPASPSQHRPSDLGVFGCCGNQKYSGIQSVLPAAGSGYTSSSRIVLADLMELLRFIDYKAAVYCS